MMWWDGGPSWWGWCVMGGGMLIFSGIITWVIVTAVRSDRGDRPTHRSPDEILAERYARGEIDKGEYDTRRATLHEHARPHR